MHIRVTNWFIALMDGSERFHEEHQDLIAKCNQQEAELARIRSIGSEHQGLIEKCKQQEGELARIRKNLAFAAQANDGKLAEVEAERDSAMASAEQEATLREHFQTEYNNLKSRMAEMEAEKDVLASQLQVVTSKLHYSLSASKNELKHSGTDKSIASISTRCSEASMSSWKSSEVGSFWKSSPWRSNPGRKDTGSCCRQSLTQDSWNGTSCCGTRSNEKLDDPFNDWDGSPPERKETPYSWSQSWWQAPAPKDSHANPTCCSSANPAYSLFTTWSRKGGS